MYLTGQKLFQSHLAAREERMSLFQVATCPAKTRVLFIFPQFIYYGKTHIKFTIFTNFFCVWVRERKRQEVGEER